MRLEEPANGALKGAWALLLARLVGVPPGPTVQRWPLDLLQGWIPWGLSPPRLRTARGPCRAFPWWASSRRLASASTTVPCLFPPVLRREVLVQPPHGLLGRPDRVQIGVRQFRDAGPQHGRPRAYQGVHPAAVEEPALHHGVRLVVHEVEEMPVPPVLLGPAQGGKGPAEEQEPLVLLAPGQGPAAAGRRPPACAPPPGG